MISRKLDNTTHSIDVTCRAEIQSGTLSGHASVFGSFASLPGHLEDIGRRAFDAVLADPDTDTRALINHDPNLLLGRMSSKTLKLSTDDSGLYFEVKLPNTTYANDLRELVERGDLSGASFGFVPGDDEWSTRAGHRVRTHTSIARLVDVSPVAFPAYSNTDVSLRNNLNRARLIRARNRKAV